MPLNRRQRAVFVEAIEVAIAVPVQANEYAYAAKVPWSTIVALREALEANGIDWRAVKAEQDERDRKTLYEREAVVVALREVVAAGGTEVAVRCGCGWDAGGDLRFVDSHATGYPPVAKGDPERWERVECGDERLPTECPRCEQELTPKRLRLVSEEPSG